MKRKIIKQGNDTLTITLPRKWCQKFCVKAGDEINLEENNNILMINSDKLKDSSEIRISFNELNQQLIWRNIYAAYRSGYDTIRVDFNPKDNYKNIYTCLVDHREKIIMSSIEVIQDAVSGMQGMVIMDQKKDYCILKDLSEITDKEFDNTLRRIFFIIEGMGEDTLGLFNEKDKNLVKSINVADNNIDRFSNYCFRILNRKGYKTFNKTSVIYSIILILEFIADEYKKVSRHIVELEKSNKLIHSIFENTNKLFLDFHKTFYNLNNKNMMSLHKDIENLEEKLKSIKLKDKEIEILHHLKKIKRFIVDLIPLRIEFEL
ncbi:MAG: hypothetical protein AABW83_04160 [Nanoarchaeota archaeon]